MRTVLAVLLIAATACSCASANTELPPFLTDTAASVDISAEATTCIGKVTEAIIAASVVPNSPKAAKRTRRKALKAAESAVAACSSDPLLLGAALSVRGGSLLALGDKPQAALDYWSALGLTGFLDFAAQANATAQLAAGPAGAPGVVGLTPRAQRATRIRNLVWASQALQALAGALADSGYGEQARQAHAASQEYVLQRWSLQSSIPGLKAATGQREIDEDEAGRRFRTQEAHADFNKPNPNMLQEMNLQGQHAEMLTWGDGESKTERRLRRGPTRRIVRDLKPLGEAMDQDSAAWDTEGGLRSIEPMYQGSWGEPYGPYVPQFVPEEHLQNAAAWSGKVAAPAEGVSEAAASTAAHAPKVGGMCELPRTYQYGATAGTTSARFFENEMFFAVFEDVFVEGPSGVVYDDNTLYLNSHAEFEPLASVFLGDGGAGTASQRPRTVIQVDSALSLVHGGHYSYQQWTTDILPRFFLAVEHLRNTAGGVKREGKAYADDIKNMKILVPGAVPFVGAFLGLLGVGMESCILFVPSHTVVHANRLWLPDWTPAQSRKAASPASLFKVPAPTETDQAVGPDGQLQASGETETHAFPEHIGMFNKNTFSSVRQALLRGDTSLYTSGPAAVHEAFRTRNNATCQHLTKRLHGKTAVRSFDKHAAEIEARAKPGTVIPTPTADGVQVFGEQPRADVHAQAPIAPRGALHLLRQSFAEKVIPDPPKDVQLDITQEIARAAEAEHGEKHRKRRGQRKFKKRKRNKKGEAKNTKQEKGEWVDAPPAWRMYGQFGSPFIWDNGTVLAYPPIRTIVVVTRDLDTFVEAKNSQAVLDAVHGFLTEAVEEVHHGGALPRDPLSHALLEDKTAVDGAGYTVRSPATVMKVPETDNATMVQMTHPMVAEHYYASDVRAAHDSGILYERALLRALEEEAHHAKVKAERAVEVQRRQASGDSPPPPAQRTTKLAGVGISHPPNLAPMPVVASRVTVVQVDASQLPVAATVRMFQQADVVVGVSGTGMTNIVFCPPTASVLEVSEHSGNTRQTAQIAAALGLDYWTQLGAVNASISSPARASALARRANSTAAAAAAATAGSAGTGLQSLAVRAAPVAESVQHTGATVNTEHLRGTLAAMLAKRVRTNAAAFQRAGAARRALWERGLLDSKAAHRAKWEAAEAQKEETPAVLAEEGSPVGV